MEVLPQALSPQPPSGLYTLEIPSEGQRLKMEMENGGRLTAQSGCLQMQKQRTLAEIKDHCEKVFADAKAEIEQARQIARECRELTAQMKRCRDELKHERVRSLKLRENSERTLLRTQLRDSVL